MPEFGDDQSAVDRLWAEAAAFAKQDALAFARGPQIFGALSALATQAALQQSPYSPTFEQVLKESNISPAQAQATMLGRFASFIATERQTGGSDISSRVEAMQAFERFDPAVKQLIAEVAAMERPEQHQAWLGAGSFCNVFRLQVEGRDYAVRLVKPARSATPGRAALIIDAYVAGCIRAAGREGFEQLIALSYNQAAMVSTYEPGRQLRQFSPAELRQFSDSRLLKFIDLALEAQALGLSTDINADGIIIDPNDVTLHMVDLQLGTPGPAREASPMEALANLAAVFAGLVRGQDTAPATLAEFQSRLEAYEVAVTLQQRTLNLAGADQQRFTPEDLAAAEMYMQQTQKRYQSYRAAYQAKFAFHP